MTVKISVVIPAYNAEATIRPCLEALLNQEVPQGGYEIIVVNDGSRDATAAIVREYPVRLLDQVNQGPAAARNNGAFAAHGELLLFTDADCIPQPGWIAALVEPFADPRVAGVKGAYVTHSPTLISRFAQLEFEERFHKLAQVESIDLVDTYSAGFRRALFVELGGFDRKFPVANNEDVEFSYRLVAAGQRLVFAPRAVVSHEHADCVRDYLRTKFWRGYWRMVVVKAFPAKLMKDSYTPQTLKLQIVLGWLLLLLLPGLPLAPGVALPALLGVSGAWFVTTLPFLRIAWRRERGMLLAVLYFLLLRGWVMGGGIGLFLIRLALGRELFRK